MRESPHLAPRTVLPPTGRRTRPALLFCLSTPPARLPIAPPPPISAGRRAPTAWTFCTSSR